MQRRKHAQLHAACTLQLKGTSQPPLCDRLPPTVHLHSHLAHCMTWDRAETLYIVLAGSNHGKEAWQAQLASEDTASKLCFDADL